MISNMQLELDTDGTLLNKGIHDSTIIDVKISGDQATVSCVSEQDQLHLFNFTGVKLFDVRFYGNQNVIRDVLVFNKIDAESDLKGLPDLEKYTFFNISDVNKKIMLGELTLVWFAPSNGAQIVILCSTVTLEG